MKGIAALVILVAAALLVHRCSTPAATLRFRITVEANTPDGIRSGSSVMELVLDRKFLIPMPGVGGRDHGGGWIVYGEMPFLDVGEGRYLFTLMHDKNYLPEHEISTVVLNGIRLYERREGAGKPSDDAIVRDLTVTRPSAEVKDPSWPALAPALALFGDMRDPRTLTEVGSAASKAPATGSYAVRRVTITIIGKDEPLTTMLATRFPQLAARRGLVALNKGGKGQHY